MKDCERYENMISLLLDGELNERETAELSAHIAGCEHCGEMAVALAAVSGALAEGLEEPPAGLHDKIMDGVSAAARAKRGQKRFQRLRPILAAAACVAVIAATVLAANRGLRMGSAENGAAPAAAPEVAMYAASAAGGAGAETTADTASDADVGGALGYAYAEEAMEAPAEAREKMDDYALRSVMDTAEDADAEPAPDAPESAVTEAAESGADSVNGAAKLLETELEIASAGEGYFTGRVLSDLYGNFAEGELLTVLADAPAAPGERVTVRYRGFDATGAGPIVTEAEIESIE